MKTTFRIGDRLVGEGCSPLVVAEMSGNHNGSLHRALDLVEAAADAGVEILKLQTYTPDTMTLNSQRKEFMIRNRRSLWKGESLYSLYQKAHTPWEWHKPLFNRCRKRGLMVFSTPFDKTAVDFLTTLRVPAFKIASFENVDLALIRETARTGKPLILSTGLATEVEIGEAVQAARSAGCRELMLLKCTSAYPAPAQDSHLRTLPYLREKFKCAVGLSDHTPGLAASLASVALGATLIERHFTLSRRDGGVDAPFSLEPDELKRLVRETREAWEALGQVRLGPTPREKANLVFRRSLFVVQSIKRGDRLTSAHIRSIRPGQGLAPKWLPHVVGKRVKRNLNAGTPLRSRDVEGFKGPPC